MKHIDPAVWAQLILAGATLLTAIAGWIKSQSNSKKLDDNTAVTEKAAKQIDEVHAATDVIKTISGNLDVSAIRNSTTKGE